MLGPALSGEPSRELGDISARCLLPPRAPRRRDLSCLGIWLAFFKHLASLVRRDDLPFARATWQAQAISRSPRHRRHEPVAGTWLRALWDSGVQLPSSTFTPGGDLAVMTRRRCCRSAPHYSSLNAESTMMIRLIWTAAPRSSMGSSGPGRSGSGPQGLVHLPDASHRIVSSSLRRRLGNGRCYADLDLGSVVKSSYTSLLGTANVRQAA